jgi:hypothetical protein
VPMSFYAGGAMTLLTFLWVLSVVALCSRRAGNKGPVNGSDVDVYAVGSAARSSG